MGKSISEWEQEVNKLTTEGREKLIKAIDTLEGWDAFAKEFGWTGLFVVRSVLKYAKEG